jgi:putative resolvase
MKAKEVKNILGVTQRTLNNYIKKGLIRYEPINQKHYIYNDEDVYNLVNKTKERFYVTYSRVSLPKQKNDLKSQSERLYDFSIRNGFKINEQYEDIKSGMSFDRKDFNKLLERISNYEIKGVIIENKDRLARFGFDLFKKICDFYGTEIIIVSDINNKTYEEELVDDLISIIHHFSMKSYSNRRKLNKIKNVLTEVEND